MFEYVAWNKPVLSNEVKFLAQG